MDRNKWLDVASLALVVLGVLLVTGLCLWGHSLPEQACPNCVPATPPAVQPAVDPNPPCFGVDGGKIRPGRHTINGNEVTEGEAHRAIGAGLPSDGDRPFLVVIGSLANRRRVLADLSSHPVLSRLRSRWRVQEYDPGEWAVRDGGYVLSGTPTIYAEVPTGEVRHRQDTYAGPASLAEALRKADPGYDPAKDPDLVKPASSADVVGALKAIPPWGWVAVIGGAMVLVLRSRKGGV